VKWACIHEGRVRFLNLVLIVKLIQLLIIEEKERKVKKWTNGTCCFYF